MNSSFSVKDKVCVITGAGKGFGREAALMYRDAGAKLALISRNEQDINTLKDELDMPESRLLCDIGDVSNQITVTKFVMKTYRKFKEIDILLNNAGMRFRKKFLATDYNDWTKVINNNLSSVFLMCQAVGRYMVSQQCGKIINVSSIVGSLGLSEFSAYAASKGSIISLSNSLAVEWAQYNINVNVIAPGFCETSYADKFKKNKKLYNFTLERTPMKRWGNSKDFVNTSLFLSSDASNYITGEIINVDGGWSAW